MKNITKLLTVCSCVNGWHECEICLVQYWKAERRREVSNGNSSSCLNFLPSAWPYKLNFNSIIGQCPDCDLHFISQLLIILFYSRSVSSKETTTKLFTEEPPNESSFPTAGFTLQAHTTLVQEKLPYMSTGNESLNMNKQIHKKQMLSVRTGVMWPRLVHITDRTKRSANSREHWTSSTFSLVTSTQMKSRLWWRLTKCVSNAKEQDDGYHGLLHK